MKMLTGRENMNVGLLGGGSVNRQIELGYVNSIRLINLGISRIN